MAKQTIFVLLLLTSCVWGYPEKPIVPMLDGRIVGGSSVDIRNFPYQISLLFFNSHFCGGSLIRQNWVLSAAHCTVGRAASQVSARAGSSIRNSGGVVIRASAIRNHASYNPRTIDFDISAVQLAASFGLGTGIQLVALALNNQNVAAGTPAVVTGWGDLWEDGPASTQLQAVTVPIVSLADCRAAYGASAITARMLCAGFLGSGGRDACQGDSGGPLVAGGRQVGVVSWGRGCARPQFPGVYASVPNLRSWIASTTGA